MEKKTRVDPALLDTAIQLWKTQDKRHWIAVTGNSMLPLMRAGDQVLVVHNCSHIQPGDVIVFWQSNQLIVHRVIRVEPTPATLRFLTKGDNGLAFDPMVSADQVIGKVLAVRRADRETLLDTQGWRLLGTSIAYTTLLIRGVLVIGQWIKRRLIGPQPHRWTRRVHQTIAEIPTRLLKFWATWVDRRKM